MNKLKAKLFFVASVTIFSLSTLLLAIFNYNPFNVEYSVFIFFYLSFFLSFSGFFTFVIIFIKSRFSASNLSNQYFWSSVRQGVLISLILTLLLALTGLKILDFWVGIPLAIAILLLELFFRGNKFKKMSS